jgi:hypothetical protein
MYSDETMPVPDTPIFSSRTLTTRDQILFKRQSFLNQMKFLEERVITAEKRGWILGPPGTGKSVAAFAFARQLATKEGWVSSWVKFDTVIPLYCIRFVGDTWSSCKITDYSDVTELFDTGDTGDTARKHAVFVDGYRSGQHCTDTFLAHTRVWWNSDMDKRRLVIIASMAIHPRKSLDFEGHEEIFFEESWDKREYIMACSKAEMLNSVKANLDASLLCDADVTNPSVDDLISAKFYYAGGSARLMFCYNTATVIRLIAEMLSRTCQKQEYIITNIADRTNQTTNGLLNSYVSSSGV